MSSSSVRTLAWPSMAGVVTEMVPPVDGSRSRYPSDRPAGGRLCARTTTLLVGGPGGLGLLADEAEEGVELGGGAGFRLRFGRGHARAGFLHRLLDSRTIERFEQVVDGVDLEGAHGVLVHTLWRRPPGVTAPSSQSIF